MAILYWASLALSIQVSYVDTIMGKELMPATESLSVYRAQSYAGGPQIHGRVPNIIMKMGTPV